MREAAKLGKAVTARILKPKRKKEERDAILRVEFINAMIQTDGKYLLHYVEIVERDSYVPCKAVIEAIRLRTGLTFNKMQVGLIHHYIEEIGASVRKRKDRTYYRNVHIKEIV